MALFLAGWFCGWIALFFACVILAGGLRQAFEPDPDQPQVPEPW